MSGTALSKLEAALDAITQAGDEGTRIFTRVYADEARAAADAADRRASFGHCLGPLDGSIVSIKDLFDVAGEQTTAGGLAREDIAPAIKDAIVVQRLRAAGAVIIGKTNMSEFAFSGVGLNPHHGTPGNAIDVSRIPGGSSSGAAISVARGMAEIAIGSDTGGSVRIPAALNGLVGFKPSIGRVPREGTFPLSFTLDTVGPLARDVAGIAQADAILSRSHDTELPVYPVKAMRLGIPRGLLFTLLESEVLEAFDQGIDALRRAGAHLADIDLDGLLGEPFRLQEKGTLVAAEAAFVHREGLAHPERYDPFVLNRLLQGQRLDAASYVGIQQARAALLPQLDAKFAGMDALLLPSTPFVAPRIADLESMGELARVNGLILRNTSVFNFFDLPALSLPLRRPRGALPVGLMVVGPRASDRQVLSIGQAIELLLASVDGGVHHG